MDSEHYGNDNFGSLVPPSSLISSAVALGLTSVPLVIEWGPRTAG